MSTNRIAYTVSWDAVATDADNNRGKSTLHVSALDVANGKLLWQKAPGQISAMYQSSLQQVVDGVLYIVATTSQKVMVIAVNTRDGHTIWQREEKWGGVSTMNICADKVYLKRSYYGIKALQTSDGKVVWSYTNNNGFVSDLLATTKTAYVMEQTARKSGNSTRSSVIALGTDNGRLLWRKSYTEQPAFFRDSRS